MHYRGHVAEHKATRERVTLCDVSHMGEIDFVGPDALALVQKIAANDASRLAVNQAIVDAKITAIFEKYDLDHDGNITTAEIQSVSSNHWGGGGWGH